MIGRRIALMAISLFMCAVIVGGATDLTLPLDHWAYNAMKDLRQAGLLPEYPAEWIAVGHPLTRHEFAYYIRSVILRLADREDRDAYAKPKHGDILPTLVEMALGRLVAEFTPELRALGVNVEPWSDWTEGPSFIDLDSLLAALGNRPDAPAVPPPSSITADPGFTDPAAFTINLDLGTAKPAYSPVPPESLSISLTEFSSPANSLISLAGELLGVEWTLGLDSGSFQQMLGTPLRIGGFAVTDASAGIQGGLGLRLGQGSVLGFDALWFLDLDQAQMAMNRLLFDVNTEVELGERMALFGSLTLEYRLDGLSLSGIDSQASAGLRLLLGEDLYLIAMYALANPMGYGSLPRWQSTSLGLSLGEIGLLLLGLQAPDLADPGELQLIGEFVYRF
ncbi:MAG: hypothetical protein ACM3X6_02055 [Patescibacteria group bacterium]